MFMRWSVCRLSARDRGTFSQTQALGTRPGPGFLGQLGGWEQQDSLQACIATFWQDEDSFLRSIQAVGESEEGEPHDETYLALSMESFACLLQSPAQCDSLSEAFWRAGCMTSAELSIQKGRVPHFLSAQRQIWRPGVQLVEGHLYGLLFKDPLTPHRFFRVNFWEEPAQAHRFRHGKERVLTELSRQHEDVAERSQRLVHLEPGWFLKAEEQERTTP